MISFSASMVEWTSATGSSFLQMCFAMTNEFKQITACYGYYTFSSYMQHYRIYNFSKYMEEIHTLQDFTICTVVTPSVFRPSTLVRKMHL